MQQYDPHKIPRDKFNHEARVTYIVNEQEKTREGKIHMIGPNYIGLSFFSSNPPMPWACPCHTAILIESIILLEIE